MNCQNTIKAVFESCTSLEELAKAKMKLLAQINECYQEKKSEIEQASLISELDFKTIPFTTLAEASAKAPKLNAAIAIPYKEGAPANEIIVEIVKGEHNQSYLSATI